jgi:hypothetical protein
VGSIVQLDRSFLLKLVLLTEIILLLGNAVAISRDYKDSWILEGLEIPFVLFVATYALVFFSEKKVSSMVLLAVIGRVTFLLIPNLKYNWFLGTAIDQHIQYGLANHVYTEGYIATQGPSTATIYGSTPFVHLTFAIFSIVLDLPVVDSVKYVPVLLSPIYPLLTYVIVKKFEFLRVKNAFKYALFISSIPISSQSFIVTGSQFGVLLAFLVLGSLVMFFQENDPRHFFVFILFTFALAAAHSASSVLLTLFLLTITLLQKISYFRLKSYLKAPQLLAATLICVAWISFPAERALEKISRLVFIGALAGKTPAAEQITPRFFELAQADILAALKTFLVFYGVDIFLLLLTFASLIILLKRLKQLDNTSKFLFLMCGVTLVSMPLSYLSKLGLFRVLHFLSTLFPIFTSIFILRTCKRRKYLIVVIISLVVLLAPIRLYKCQPLIPSANTLKEDLPASEPIVHVTGVNSIYQRQMIEFASVYVRGGIACDLVTREQIVGLTDFSFSVAYLTGYYPLDKRQLEKRYDYFLVHLPGASGPFNEQAEIRTRDLILEAICNSSVIYTNGESYTLTHCRI